MSLNLQELPRLKEQLMTLRMPPNPATVGTVRLQPVRKKPFSPYLRGCCPQVAQLNKHVADFKNRGLALRVWAEESISL